jgi:hypothetical protein
MWDRLMTTESSSLRILLIFAALPLAWLVWLPTMIATALVGAVEAGSRQVRTRTRIR